MPSLTPLRFQPLFRRYLWGGRRLGTLLGKPLGEGNDYAESWELVDHGADQSVVRFGPEAGATLAELLTNHPAELLGRHANLVPRQPISGSCAMRPQFPLLAKFLDAHSNLSVQVHPNDQQAACQVPPDLGKTEAWIVLDRVPGARIYAGLKRGFDREALKREVLRGTTELCLHHFEPNVGDCVFIPAGTVHAIGAGLVVAEIQQSSDTTFRLFDWNRVGPDGKPRPLHIEQALAVIDFTSGPVGPCQPHPTVHPACDELVACDKFVLRRWRLERPTELGGDDRFHLLVVLQGEVKVASDPASEPLRFGETMLLPAAAGPVTVTPLPPSIVLDAFLPDNL